MSKDFQTKQIRTSQIILSGGVDGSYPNLAGIVYSGSSATDTEGTFESGLLGPVGQDVSLFFSGAIGATTGKVLFGGDVTFSGSTIFEGTTNITSSINLGNWVIDEDDNFDLIYDFDSVQKSRLSQDSKLFVTGAILPEDSTDGIFFSGSLSNFRIRAQGDDLQILRSSDTAFISFDNSSTRFVLTNGANTVYVYAGLISNTAAARVSAGTKHTLETTVADGSPDPVLDVDFLNFQTSPAQKVLSIQNGSIEVGHWRTDGVVSGSGFLISNDSTTGLYLSGSTLDWQLTSTGDEFHWDRVDGVHYYHYEAARMHVNHGDVFEFINDNTAVATAIRLQSFQSGVPTNPAIFLGRKTAFTGGYLTAFESSEGVSQSLIDYRGKLITSGVEIYEDSEEGIYFSGSSQNIRVYNDGDELRFDFNGTNSYRFFNNQAYVNLSGQFLLHNSAGQNASSWKMSSAAADGATNPLLEVDFSSNFQTSVQKIIAVANGGIEVGHWKTDGVISGSGMQIAADSTTGLLLSSSAASNPNWQITCYDLSGAGAVKIARTNVPSANYVDIRAGVLGYNASAANALIGNTGVNVASSAGFVVFSSNGAIENKIITYAGSNLQQTTNKTIPFAVKNGSVVVGGFGDGTQSPPSPAEENRSILWFERGVANQNDKPVLNLRDKDGNFGWSSIHNASGAMYITRNAVTASTYSLTPSGSEYYVGVDYSSTAASQIDLPLINLIGTGRVYKIKDSGYSSPANNITIAPSGSDTINNAANYIISGSGDVVEIVSNENSSDWEILSHYSAITG